MVVDTLNNEREITISNPNALTESVSVSLAVAVYAQSPAVRDIVGQFRVLAYWFDVVGIQHQLFTATASGPARLTCISVSVKNGGSPYLILNALVDIYYWLSRSGPFFGFPKPLHGLRHLSPPLLRSWYFPLRPTSAWVTPCRVPPNNDSTVKAKSVYTVSSHGVNLLERLMVWSGSFKRFRAWVGRSDYSTGRAVWA